MKKYSFLKNMGKSVVNLHKRVSAFCMAAVMCFVPVGVGMRQDIANVYSHKENEDMKIAITFDDGPHKTKTPEILDILKKYDVPATFFVVGSCAENYPDIISRELAEGHEIGNHTFSHISLVNGDMSEMEKEILMTERMLFENFEYRPKLFRPPEGVCNKKIASVAASLDYSVILWNIDTRDWAHTSKDDIVNMVLRNIESGDIILFHDAISGESHTAEALKVIIPALKEKGYKFVKVSELIMTR